MTGLLLFFFVLLTLAGATKIIVHQSSAVVTLCPATTAPATTLPCTLIALNITDMYCNNAPIGGGLAVLGAAGTPVFFLNSTTGGTAVVLANGAFTFTPTNVNTTFGTINFTVTDNNGCIAHGTEGISITLTPVVMNETIVTVENVAVNGSIAGLVSGGSQPYMFFASAVSNGTVMINRTTGAFVFTPNTNFTGIAQFQYIVRGATIFPCFSNPGFVFINVTATDAQVLEKLNARVVSKMMRNQSQHSAIMVTGAATKYVAVVIVVSAIITIIVIVITKRQR